MKELLQLILFFALLILLAPLSGRYMARVFLGEKHIMLPVLGWLEKLIYMAAGVQSEEEMNWRTYSIAILLFNLFGFLLLFLLLLFQKSLPLNIEKQPDLSWHLALNTAISFMTNTNWQAYSGENTLGYLV